jgi:two-component system sensor kinase FixL
MQSELLHLSRLNDMGQLATAFAHELNQPLSAISAYIGGVRRLIESGDMARALEGCDRAGAQVVRAGEVIRRLRDFVRKGDGRRRDEDLRQIVDEAITLALLDAHSDGVEIVSAVAGNAASAFIDKVQVQQVLVNLLRNAAEAMAGTARKRLTISTRRLPGDKVEIAVADTGAGLSEEVVARLFQPFVTTKATGMGVGLSLCRSIVESMGGEISAENGSDGGAVFRFTGPAA